VSRRRGPVARPAAPTRVRVPTWLPISTLLLSLAGLGISIYLTLTHYLPGAVHLYCSSKGIVNCGLVTTSPESMVFGVIPVAVLGLPFFVAMVALQGPWAWRSPRREVHLLRMASLIVGLGFVFYLLYTELFTVNAICLWCSSVHAITLVLFVLTVIGAALRSPAAGSGADERRYPAGVRGG
jgi:uncharacterized membrane protein